MTTDGSAKYLQGPLVLVDYWKPGLNHKTKARGSADTDPTDAETGQLRRSVIPHG